MAPPEAWSSLPALTSESGSSAVAAGGVQYLSASNGSVVNQVEALEDLAVPNRARRIAGVDSGVDTEVDEESVMGVLKCSSQTGTGAVDPERAICFAEVQAVHAGVEEGWDEHDPFGATEELVNVRDGLEEGDMSGVWCEIADDEEEDDSVTSCPAKRPRL
ncbi:uncharacterized protein [Lolium perenne]|uniref:uncharacterized protein n=1 Tax=Lolium perenne TaxID=4522 RepID=UPI0021F588D3|nr:uncharacterized protein LOC127302678 [Lolium perenne]XP_051189187.1 uncharacterized protein LOC127302684 [Lolium perenne]